MHQVDANAFLRELLQAQIISVEGAIVPADSEILGPLFEEEYANQEYNPVNDDTWLHHGNGDMIATEITGEVPEPLRHLLDYSKAKEKYFMDFPDFTTIDVKEESVLRFEFGTESGCKYLYVHYPGIFAKHTLAYIESILDRFGWERFEFHPKRYILDEDGNRTFPKCPFYMYHKKLSFQIPGLHS